MEQASNPATDSSRLLILVQAVDLDDPLMGFFHEWLREAAKNFSQITVLALRVGRHDLPSHIQVIPLRSRGSRSRVQALWTMWRESWKRRKEYDAVFLRGDAQYVLLTGWLWRLLGKRIVLWYAHYKVNKMVLPASWIAHVTTASVPEALAHPRIHPVFIGQNISQDTFVPRTSVDPVIPLRLLTLGRVVRVKGIKECVEAFLQSGLEKGGATLTIVGPRPDPVYEAELSALIASHPSIVWGPSNVPYDQLPGYLRSFDVLLNAYPASLDKVIIESMMSGVIPVVTTQGLRHCLPSELHWLIAPDLASRTNALRRVAALSAEERSALGHQLRQIALESHSLRSQIQRLKRLCFPA